MGSSKIWNNPKISELNLRVLKEKRNIRLQQSDPLIYFYPITNWILRSEEPWGSFYIKLPCVMKSKREMHRYPGQTNMQDINELAKCWKWQKYKWVQIVLAYKRCKSWVPPLAKSDPSTRWVYSYKKILQSSFYCFFTVPSAGYYLA